MVFDFTDLVIAVLGILGTVITVKVIPWIRLSINKEELEKALMWASVAVKAAEQLAKTGEIKMEERKDYAMKYLLDKGIKLDIDQISNIVESFVLELPELVLKENESSPSMDDGK